MKFLIILALACTASVVSAQVCSDADIMLVLDQSENAARASSEDRVNAPFYYLKLALRNLFGNQRLNTGADIRFGAIGYSASTVPITIVPPGSTPAQALNGVDNTGTGINSGSWTYQGLQNVTNPPLVNRSNLLILVSSQGSNDTTRRNLALQESRRLWGLGWRLLVIVCVGSNKVDIAELQAVNNGTPPLILTDRNPVNPADPKGYKPLSDAFSDIVTNILCNGSLTTTTVPPPQTQPTTQRNTGVCSQCMYEAGFGFDYHETNCDSFYLCLQSGTKIMKHCPATTFWDGSTCNFMNRVQCPTAQCGSLTSQARYASGRCCNRYYQCSSGSLQDQACPVDQAYDTNTGNCFRPSNLTEYCRTTDKYLCDVNLNGPVDPSGCAGYSPDPFGDPCKYIFGGQYQNVAAGTIWRQDRCTLWPSQGLCMGVNTTERDLPRDPAATCNAVFLTNYEGGNRNVYSERLQRDLNVYSSFQEAYLNSRGVIFEVNMKEPFLYYPFFSNRETTSNSAFKIRFRLENFQLNTAYDILSNNYCVLCPETISFTVTATSNNMFIVTATFLTTAGTVVSTYANIETTASSDQLELIVIYGDTTVSGKLYVLTGINNPYKSVDFLTVPKPATYNIQTSRCGFQFGRGPNTHFTGVLLGFSFYDNCQNISSVIR